MKSLNLARKAAAIVVFAAFLAVFARFDSFAGLYPFLIGPQFMPALFSSAFAALVVIFLVTLFSGRIYCSVVCPLGLIQDFFSRLGNWKKRPAFAALPDFFRTHLVLSSLMLAGALAGFLPFLVMAEPFSLAGRILTNVWQPASSRLMLLIPAEGASWLNKARVNPIASESFVIVLLVSLLLFLAVKKWGRIYCNLICPVGAILRLVSGFAIFRLSLNEPSCTSCGLCSKSCKAGCIDIKTRKLDFSRCVMCLNCVAVCNSEAINFKFAYANKPRDFSPQRRALLGSAASAAVVGLIPMALPAHASPKLRILPPGSGNVKDFTNRCISCHLCVSACPSAIIRVIPPEFFNGSLAQPELNFSRGMCEQTCNVCTNICPTGAIKPVSLVEKTTLKIAEVAYKIELCVVETDGKDCGACAEHCPTKAVRMVPYKNGLMIPEVTPEICIGCGSCEHICPVRPERAIIVNPIEKQHHIKLPEAKPVEDAGPLEEFPF